jgi:Family of unknown function (DUF6339)
MMALRKLIQPLTPEMLKAALGGQKLPTEPTEATIDLTQLEAAIEALDPALKGPEIDRALVEPIHIALADLTRGEAAEMRVWHWLTSTVCPDLVWRRWRGSVPAAHELEDALTPAMFRRFAGRSTLNGVSRNALARLWWVVEHCGNDFDLARVALSSQDMFQAIFERLFGIYEPAARACLVRFEGRSEDDIRRATRWLNYAASTTVLEALGEEEVGLIVDAGLASA